MTFDYGSEQSLVDVQGHTHGMHECMLSVCIDGVKREPTLAALAARADRVADAGGHDAAVRPRAVWVALGLVGCDRLIEVLDVVEMGRLDGDGTADSLGHARALAFDRGIAHPDAEKELIDRCLDPGARRRLVTGILGRRASVPVAAEREAAATLRARVV
jgi:hypothetical protein